MLKDKRVFITGGAAGIGFSTVKKFWQEGAELIVFDMVDISQTEFSKMERIKYIKTDVTSKEGVELIAQEMKNGVDVLINNAGITRDASILKMSEEMWDSVIDVNLKAVWKLSQLAIAQMKEQNSGVILNAASVVAHYGNFGQSNYVATKAGVIGLTKTLAKEVGKYGIRVNSVAPGFILAFVSSQSVLSNTYPVGGVSPA